MTLALVAIACACTLASGLDVAVIVNDCRLDSAAKLLIRYFSLVTDAYCVADIYELQHHPVKFLRSCLEGGMNETRVLVCASA